MLAGFVVMKNPLHPRKYGLICNGEPDQLRQASFYALP
jgi:hypothetical protein